MKYRYFKGKNGKTYKKETDKSCRSWWYEADFEYGYSINWIICNGKPEIEMQEIGDPY